MVGACMVKQQLQMSQELAGLSGDKPKFYPGLGILSAFIGLVECYRLSLLHDYTLLRGHYLRRLCCIHSKRALHTQLQCKATVRMSVKVKNIRRLA